MSRALSPPTADPALLRAVQQAFPSSRRLDARELRELLALLRPALIPEGEVLFYDGDPPGPAWLLLEGRVRVEVAPAGQRTVVLGRLGPGAFVGDMSLVDGRPRAATARVEAPLWALRLEPAAWAQLKGEAHPAALWLAAEIDRHVAQRVRAMYERVARLKEEPELAADLPAPPTRPTWSERLRALWERP